MKTRFVLLLLCFSLVYVNSARAKTILPDSCGDDSVKFDVKSEKDQPPPAGPTAGKAQIIFIENSPNDGTPTVRFGMDGAWVGANKGNSYFTLLVDPGVHHLCISWQTAQKRLKKSIDVASFTAEAGKIYYYAAEISTFGGSMGEVVPMTPTATGGMTAAHTVGGRAPDISFGLAVLDEDMGKFRVKAEKLATWTTK